MQFMRTVGISSVVVFLIVGVSHALGAQSSGNLLVHILKNASFVILGIWLGKQVRN